MKLETLMNKLPYLAIIIISILFKVIFFTLQRKLFFKENLYDLDYRVVLEGADYITTHGTPYERHTYRYTPLLAWLILGLKKFFGNYGGIYVYMFIDFINGYLIYLI